jgi:tryptophanyl-tRNA synthetase
MRADLRAGLGWGDAKQRTVELIESHLGPMRARYEELMAHPERVEDALMEGAAKARAVATPLLRELREAVGLRKMVALPQTQKTTAAKAAALPLFKQYRENDGRFYFKLTAANGTTLLQSSGLADGREAGQWVKRLKTEGSKALDEAPVEFVDRAGVEAALAELLVAAVTDNKAENRA